MWLLRSSSSYTCLTSLHCTALHFTLQYLIAWSAPLKQSCSTNVHENKVLPWLSPVLQPLDHLIVWNECINYSLCFKQPPDFPSYLFLEEKKGGPSMSSRSKVWVFTQSYMVSDVYSIQTSRQCHVHTMHRVESSKWRSWFRFQCSIKSIAMNLLACSRLFLRNTAKNDILEISTECCCDLQAFPLNCVKP